MIKVFFKYLFKVRVLGRFHRLWSMHRFLMVKSSVSHTAYHYLLLQGRSMLGVGLGVASNLVYELIFVPA